MVPRLGKNTIDQKKIGSKPIISKPHMKSIVINFSGIQTAEIVIFRKTSLVFLSSKTKMAVTFLIDRFELSFPTNYLFTWLKNILPNNRGMHWNTLFV